MNEYLIATDIGGTRLRVAVYPAGSTRPISQKRIPTSGEESSLERLKGLIAELWPTDGTVRAIAAAAPGYLDPTSGILFEAPNIPGWENLPLRQELQDRFGVPVAIGNDANLAAMGEWRYGAGQGHHNLLFLTISTGIGGGAIVNDQLLQGHRGLAGEFGHVTVMQDGPLCGCGQRGHLEAVASGTGIAHWVAGQLAQGMSSTLSGNPTPSAREIAQAAEEGDNLCVQAFARAGYFLGQGLASFLHLLNPSIVILGGGVSRSGTLIMEPLHASLRQHLISPEYLNDLVITTATLGDDAGLMGALALAEATR
ncbi:MAG TPA: ROK family protein [Anaerolineaceae bacterium]|nr:ROK family protein [Anaerolineaceae bacterium]